MKYNPSRDIPRAVRAIRSTRPVDIVDWILVNRNVERGGDSITNWFARHPTVKEDLERELVELELPSKVIMESVFVSGTFESYPTVEKWTREMRREPHPVKGWKDLISSLKRVCKGVYPIKGIDLKNHGWVLKHPDRFSLDDAVFYMDLMSEHYPDIDTSNARGAMRSFLESKGIHVGKTISGKKHKSAGKFAKLYVERETLQLMFDWLKTVNYEAYVVDYFMFKTGTRVTATLAAKLDTISVEGIWREIRVLDKGDKLWDKHISPDLWKEIVHLTGYPEKRVSGKIFTILKKDLTKLNKEALKRYYPEIWDLYPDFKDVNHFYRHMFAQHMLRKTDWKYGIVASLGGWDVKSLEESYGKPPRAIVREWGLTNIPEL